MKRTITIRNRTFQMDFGFIFILLLMWFTSIFALYNAFNLIKEGSSYSYMIRQSFWYLIGFATVFLLTSLQNRFIYRFMKDAYRYLMYALLYLFASRLTASFLGFTLPFAPPINGAISWFIIPLLGSFQPSEFMKVVLIVLVSQAITEHQNKFPDPTVRDDLRLIFRVARILVPPLILIFMQPDTGVCIIIFFTIFVMLVCSGLRRGYVITAFVSIAVVVGGFFYLYLNHQEFLASIISAYRLQRIEAWLNPESYIRGSSNQLYTALLSLGSAGLTGYGMQANIISIPEAHTDFIFAAIGQCFGLAGTSAIVLLCLILDLYLCKIAYNTKDRTDRFIVIGVIAMLLYQQMQNLSMIIGLLPITGITLPLISYGGSSILSYFISFAIILNISPAKKEAIHLFNRRRKTKLV